MTTGKRLSDVFDSKGLTPYKVHLLTGVSQSTIGRILKDESKPNGSTIATICNAINVNLDWILNGIGPVETLVLKENEAIYDIQVKHIDGLTSSIMEVPLVTQYAYAGYLGGYSDPEYIDQLPKVPFILDKEYKGQYICFEVKGDSMECDTDESIPEGSILLCRNVKQDYWKSKLHINKWDFVIVTKNDGILVKRILNHDVEKGIITIHSLNDFYSDKEIHLKDVQQIFNIVEVQQKRKRR
jgi:phage repressor protein C with HTH and peptisase S24 domain